MSEKRAPTAAKLVVQPLTPARWADLEIVFGARGCSVARGCWCMYYRRSGTRAPLAPGMTHAQGNRAALKALVDADKPPGLIGYHSKQPVGWVSLGPREEFAKLKRSPIMKPVDDLPVWSIVCFVVPSAHRGQGLAHELLRGAVSYARKNGATMLEAYPVDKPERSSDDSMWFGSRSLYAKAGFEEVARRKAHRPIMRLAIGKSASASR